MARDIANGAGEAPLAESPLTANAGPAAKGWDKMFRQDYEASLTRSGKLQPRGQPLAQPQQPSPTANADSDVLPPVTADSYGW